MGKIFSTIKHPFRNFNLESRAHKIISQSKPAPAPKHEKDKLVLERNLKEFPGVYEESLKKNDQLDTYLKNVYVTSFDPVQIKPKNDPDPNRPLPKDRTLSGGFLFGMQEPEKVPLGKTTLRNALEFITRHQSEPRVYNSKNIAEEYLIPEEKVKQILQYYRVFEVYIPIERKTKAKFAGPSIPKIEIVQEFKKKLPPPNSEKKD